MRQILITIASCALAIWSGYHWPISVPCAGPSDPINAECRK